MRRLAVLCALCLLAFTLDATAQAVGRETATAGTHAVSSLTRLQRTLTRDLTKAGGTHGALVVDLRTGATLFASHAAIGRVPASVEKLYTTSTALLGLGPTARLRTEVLGIGSLTHETWHGTLYLRGAGDPTFGSASFIRAAYDGAGATVERLAANVRATGIRRVDGRIVGDESIFDDLRGTPYTDYEPSLVTEGELSGLSFNAGFTNAYEDALQPRPDLFATRKFVAALRADGVSVPSRTPIYTGTTPADASELAGVSSPTVSTLIKLTNTPSDNFFAETLLKDIGARLGGGGTTADGAAVVRSDIAEHFGLRPRLDDGSGLSLYDRSSPDQIVSLLRQQATDVPFVNSLAVAGVSGTMQDEMVGTRGADNCRGKTGTMSDVANLVGYCTARNGDVLAFAFLLNDQSNSDTGHAIEDEMGEALANYP